MNMQTERKDKETQRFRAEVHMIDFRQVEFELPDGCDEATIELEAELVARHKFGKADEFVITGVEKIPSNQSLKPAPNSSAA